MAKKAPKKESEGDDLLKALQFVNVAQLQAGQPYTQHCIMFGDTVYATTGTLSAGHKIEEHFSIAPHTAKLIAALQRCEERVSLSELTTGLSVRSGKFKSIVPCTVLQDMPNVWPDPPVGTLIDAPFRAALAAVGPLATEGAQKVFQAAVKMASGYVVATNGLMIIQSWHGIDMPELLVPKASIKALESVKTAFSHFGFSSNSATFYYEDGSWIKTQLYTEAYPNFEKVLNVPSQQWPIPANFFDGLRTLKPFIQESRVFFSRNMLHTDEKHELSGSCIELDGLSEGHSFNPDMLLLLEGVADTVDFGKPWANAVMHFKGATCRGALSPIKWYKPVQRPTNKALPPEQWSDMDDDIPF